MSEILAIASDLDSASAIERVEALGVGRAELETELFYPYYRFDVRGRLRSLFGDRQMQFHCLVDARTAHAATADGFTTERRLIDDPVCLATTQSPAAAARQARRYASHALGRASRTAANFDLRLDEHGIVYRSFFIVVCADLRLLVDGATGDLHPLQGLAGAA